MTSSKRHSLQPTYASKTISTTTISKSSLKEAMQCTSIHWSCNTSTSIITIIGMHQGSILEDFPKPITGGRIAENHFYTENWRKCWMNPNQTVSQQATKINMLRQGLTWHIFCWTFPSTIRIPRSITWGKSRKYKKKGKRIHKLPKILSNRLGWYCPSVAPFLVFLSEVI